MRSGYNQTYTLLIALVLALALLQGCAIRSVYVPLTQNAPLFDSNKQVKASGFLGTNHVELQIAHNPAEHFAFVANVDFGSGISVYNGALGIYGHCNDMTWRYELFGGYGYNTNVSYNNGNILSPSQKISYDVNGQYQQFYLQPSLGFFSRIHMYRISYSFSLSTRISYLYFADYLFREKDLALSTAALPVYKTNKEYNDKGVYAFEPCLSNKVGIKNVYAILQVQSISPFSQAIDVSNTKFSPAVFFSFGIQYVFTFKVK